jgi:ABC-type branched-subunit amino acid transport system ATPase component
VLLLDEPAAGLDPVSSSALFRLVKQLQVDLGLTVLLVEHYVKAVLDTCDLIYVLAEGEVLAQGSADQIAENTDVRRKYLGANRYGRQPGLSDGQHLPHQPRTPDCGPRR